ncbi:hypothetical protein HYFRA_00002752 [Hymenoscyphus fraxineus]|uniref:Deacetylase sirtuin-type domain-containing protein n=1 Tax=Hymenoscyphus fraxineus TaxID=746836 RepID=A0A9N9KMK0_9HELO|nr:hypothetical protein HYFRA_00002752 [Hymenoscyphus fraxineus]
MEGATGEMSTLSSPLSSVRSSQLSSPLSSVASRSPTPPVDYPSPPLSNEDSVMSPARDPDHAPEREGPPPAKRRKIATLPKDEKTQYLDLIDLGDSDDDSHHKSQDAKLEKLMQVLRTKRKIVVIAGAGISVSAGIPDFRSSTGLFTTLRSQHKLKSSGKHLFDASVYRDDSSTSSFHDMVRELSHLTKNASPTPFHHMLATLAEEGRLMRLYTQNVDGIDTALEPLATNVPLNSKGPWPKTVQLHGGLEKMVCTKCGKLSDFDGALFEGPETPSCKECEETDAIRMAGGLRSHGIGRLRPRMVLYNEFNPDEEAIGAVSHADIKTRPDAVLVVGTSLKVPGIRRLARELCNTTRDRRGGFTAWINVDPEPMGNDMKDCWDMVVRARCDDVAQYVGLPHWNDKNCGDYKIPEGGVVHAGGVSVVLESKPATIVKNRGILTPSDSPRHQSPTPYKDMPKLKQPQLSFAAASAPANPVKLTKAGKPKEKPGPKPGLKASKSVSKPARKPKTGAVRKALPGTKPRKNALTSAFTATKTELSIGKLPKSEFGAPPSTPMQPVSPSDPRTNSDAFARSSQVAVEISVTYDRHETVSPKGRLPNGMANLLS